MRKETACFLRELKNYKGIITSQQYRTIEGQAKSGDIEGARKGLNRLVRGEKSRKE